MRKVLVVSLGVVAAMALALPAQAKVEGTAFVSGPGLPGGGAGAGGGSGGGDSIRMDGSDGGGYPMMSGLVDSDRFLTQEPKGELGPRYESRLVITAPNGQPDVVQHLYPFAEGGPVLYTPPGQEFIMAPTGEATGGWFRMSSDLLRELRDRGLPKTSPVAPHPADGTTVAQPTTPWPSPMVWGLVLVFGLLVAGALAGRRRAAVRRAA
jgi:hypothetical protein